MSSISLNMTIGINFIVSVHFITQENALIHSGGLMFAELRNVGYLVYIDVAHVKRLSN